MHILGLNAYHGDSSACLVRDGEMIAAAEEERFRRVKHWAGLPTRAIEFCLREAGIEFDDVNYIAVNRQPRINNFRRLKFIITHRPDLRLLVNRLRSRGTAKRIDHALNEAFPGKPFHGHVINVEHHYTHLASAFLMSSFDEAVCLSVDGFGDFASAAWGMGRDGSIEIDDRIYFPHSLGIFYSALTQYLGFPHFGDEYKVMGLAPYGEPRYLDALRQVVLVEKNGEYRLNLKFFRHHNENVAYTWNDCSPEVGTLYTDALEELLGPARDKSQPLEQKHKDIARSTQAMYEEAFFALLTALYEKYRCPNLALAGGCAMNSVANGKVYLKTPFRRMYLPAAAGDAGGAIGAALAIWEQARGREQGAGGREQGARSREQEVQSAEHTPHSPLPAPRSMPPAPYWGPGADDHGIKQLLKSKSEAIKAARCDIQQIDDAEELCRRTAQAIGEGKVIGWFQGRMEWGPRALGNRSILCDPRRADMKDILNAKIKRRESFRPFAPSVLREAVAAWFEQEDDVPFMMQVFQIRPEKRALIPAVTHVDGSGRLQTVHRETNPLYHQLIQQFEAMTGVPMVLNTSFNENEPVVCRPEEALDCFLRTRMDVLVLGSYYVVRGG